MYVRLVFERLLVNGPFTRYAKLRVEHEPGMPGTFSPRPRVRCPDMHHGMCVTHVPWCMPGSLTSGFLWSRWRAKRSRHSLHMRNPQFYVSGKWPMELASHQMEFCVWSLSSMMKSSNGNIFRVLNSPYEGQWRGTMMFSLICAWTNGRVNTRHVGDFRRHHLFMTL